ncbi:MAG TPA: hypothetical protein PKC39_07180 [Ferruginibacter sp.]|nr:hypothetical protein [Ferruginibacter sp.]HMP20724.1 hypothetical protein [Ferruginibacter sp.]
MEQHTDIQTELAQLSPLLAALPKTSVFTVSEGYFESIALTVLAGINENQSTITVENAATVPPGYFDQLASNILEKIKLQQSTADELQQLSPLLAAVPKQNLQSVPENYFEQLPQSILQQTGTAGAKIIPIKKRPALFRYAAAAVVTGLLALGVYKYASIPVNPAANNIATLDPIIEKGRSMSDAEFEQALKNVSSDAVAQYLLLHGSEADMAALEDNIDESVLPGMDELLLNDNIFRQLFDDAAVN